MHMHCLFNLLLLRFVADVVAVVDVQACVAVVAVVHAINATNCTFPASREIFPRKVQVLVI